MFKRTFEAQRPLSYNEANKAEDAMLSLEVTNTADEMVDRLKAAGVVKSVRVEQALRKVDRKLFVPDELKEVAYVDQALKIGEEQTISQPTTVAFMLELLNPKLGEHILEIGGGSGWLAALLAALVGQEGDVVSAEIIEPLYKFGSTNLRAYNLPQLHFVHTDASHGLSEYAPYDKIVASAAFYNIPDELFEQLKSGGTMVIPSANYMIEQYDKKTSGQVIKKQYEGYIFVPVTGKVREVIT